MDITSGLEWLLQTKSMLQVATGVGPPQDPLPPPPSFAGFDPAGFDPEAPPIPTAMLTAEDVQARLTDLEAKKKDAAGREDYVEAQRLKGEIEALKSQAQMVATGHPMVEGSLLDILRGADKAPVSSQSAAADPPPPEPQPRPPIEFPLEGRGFSTGSGWHQNHQIVAPLPPPAPIAIPEAPKSSGSGPEKSKYVLAKGPDGKRVWINRITGEMRPSLPSTERSGTVSAGAPDSILDALLKKQSRDQDSRGSHSAPTPSGPAGSAHIVQKSDFVLAKGPDGKRVWINKLTGEIRPHMPTNERSGAQDEDMEEKRHEAAKGAQVQSIVKNVVSAFAEKAGQHLRSAEVALPPLAQPPRVAKPRAVPALPEDAVSFLPDASGQAVVPRRSRSRSRRRSRSRDRRRDSDGYRPPSPRRRKRSRDRSRSNSRKRLGGFSKQCPNISDPTSLLPTGFSTGAARSSKFSEGGDVVPEPMACAMNRLLGRKVLQLPESHIRALFGRGGATIQHIMRVTNAAIKIDHKGFGNPFGLVTIANNTQKAVALIMESLDASGCPSSMVQDVTENVSGMT